VFLTDASDKAEVRLAGFDDSEVFKTGQHFSNIVGNVHYLAPETFKYKGTPLSDVWACGIVAYSMLAGYMPYSGITGTSRCASCSPGLCFVLLGLLYLALTFCCHNFYCLPTSRAHDFMLFAAELVASKIIEGKSKPDFTSPVWGPVSVKGKDMLACMIERNPKQRLKASQALKHAWIAESPPGLCAVP